MWKGLSHLTKSAEEEIRCSGFAGDRAVLLWLSSGCHCRCIGADGAGCWAAHSC